MSTVRNPQTISVDDYLMGELQSTIKHEFVDGKCYAMSGGTNDHNRIASRTLVALGSLLGNTKCEPYNSDTKVRVRIEDKTCFYYPDAMVVCESNSGTDTYQDHPVIIVEVISDSTRRTDEGEKRENYLTIESLNTYILLEQDAPLARAYQRTSVGDFLESVYSSPDAEIPLPALGGTLRLRDIYRGF